MSSHPGIDFNRRLAARAGNQGLTKKSHHVISHPVDAEELRRRLNIVMAEDHARDLNDRFERTEQTEKNRAAYGGKVRRQSSSKLQKPASKLRELVRRSQYIPGESTGHLETGATVESTRSKGLSGRGSQRRGGKVQGRGDARQSRILEEPVKMDVARNRHSLFVKNPIEIPGARESVHKDGLSDSPHGSKVARRISMISVTDAGTLKPRPTSTVLDINETIIEGPLIILDSSMAEMRRVDWSQSDEIPESEKRMRNSLLRKRNSVLLSKGRADLNMGNQNEELSLISERDENPSLRPVRFGFFAKMRRIL